MTAIMYLDKTTGKHTNTATEALKWHNAGHSLEIHKLNEKAHRVDISTLSGKPQEPKQERDENREHCKRIADELDDYIEGRVFKCPECGEIITVDDDREKHLCSCGYVDDIDEFEQLGIYDFLEDVYDIEYRIGSDKELRSVQIMVACGGPNIYLDTASKRVELYWWCDSAYYPLSYNAVAALDEWAEEYYQC